MSSNGCDTSTPPPKNVFLEDSVEQPSASASQSSRPTSPKQINHMSTLSGNLASLFLNSEYSDVNLIVEGVTFPAHRIILAARSEYFRALLFGGMRESQENEVHLSCVTVKAFKIVLKYVYSGVIVLGGANDVTLDVLGLSHQWGFTELESSICEFLENSLEVSNICAILDTALAYGLTELTESCCAFADANTPILLQHPTFLTLSPNGLSTLLSRDSFCAAEERIFEAIVEWTKHQDPDLDYSDVLKSIRFPLMNLNTLLEVVRPTGLVSSDLILDAIRAQNNAKVVPLRYRGYLVPEENVAHAKHGATVLKGEMRQAILDGDVQNYDIERGFTRHIIEDNAVAGLCSDVSSGGIVIRLKQQCILNHIRMLLWDKDLRSYSYYIETSIDEEDWVKVCDHTRYHCRSWQNIFFPYRVVRYIKIVGTHNTVNRMFHVVAVQAYYTNKKFNLCPKSGLLMPHENVASVKHSAFVIEGVSRSRNALINGETTGYDWDSGYTCHQLGSGAIVVQLAQPYVISSMRLLLWDCDDRIYSYYIEVSTDHEKWVMVANRSKMKCKSWQVLTFKPIAVVYIRIVGIQNTANEVFHCVHFECPAQIELDDEECGVKQGGGDNNNGLNEVGSDDVVGLTTETVGLTIEEPEEDHPLGDAVDGDAN